ncbi:MAG: trigger factor [Proteobacteria bacterium]|nr:trigger factor [Pseudomonadota bacterium]
MMVSVEALKGLERRMQVSVPASRVEQQVDKRLLNVSRTARIKGFRPGKAPIHVVRKHYGAQVREEVVSDLIRETFAEAVQREQLVPAGGPRIQPLATDKGGDLKYSATFEVYPRVEIAGIEGMELVRPKASVAASDVDAMIESLRKQRPNFVAVERASADGDRLTIDFEGRLDGEPFEGGKAQGHQFTLGAGRMLKDFEDGLRGAAAGETRTFDVAFPADYPAKNLAGRTAQFTVTVGAVDEVQLPAVDDDFCKAFGVDEGGVEALRTEVRENMERELAQAVRNRLKAQVMDKLLAANPLELPSVLVEQEIRDMQVEALRRMGARSTRQMPPREPFEANARRRVALGLLLNEAIRKAGIKLDATKVQARLDDLVSGFEDAAAAREQYTGNEGAMRQLQMMVLEDQVVDHIVGAARVTEQPATFKDIMNFGAEEASED